MKVRNVVIAIFLLQSSTAYTQDNISCVCDQSLQQLACAIIGTFMGAGGSVLTSTGIYRMYSTNDVKSKLHHGLLAITGAGLMCSGLYIAAQMSQSEHQ